MSTSNKEGDGDLNLKPAADSEESEKESSGDGRTNDNDGDEVKVIVDKNGDGDDKGDDNMVELTLSEDIYSMMFTSKIFSRPFLFAIFVFCFQMGFIMLILVDLVELGSGNPLKLPPGVTKEVTAAQAMSILLLLAVQEDILEGCLMIHQGIEMIQDKAFEKLREKDPSVSCGKWFLASFLQFFAGCGLLVVIFILIMQSTDIIGMMLNFAALSFVSEIDNVAFALAQRGFVSKAVRKETDAVSEFKIKQRGEGNSLRRLLFLVIFFGLISVYSILVHQQQSGRFLCQSIGVQFGDEYDSFLAPLSGAYDQGPYINGRVTYYQRANPPRAMFAYCERDERWTFTWWAHPSWRTESQIPDSWSGMFTEEDPCNWHARSDTALKEFDITATDTSRWEVINKDVPAGTFYFEQFSLWCNDCTGVPGGCGEFRGESLGQCVDNKCECNKGRYGSHCEFPEPCPFVAIDQRKDNARLYRGTWELYKHPNDTNNHALANDRPVYVTYGDDNETVDVLAFRGRRWIAGKYSIDLFNYMIEDARANRDRGNIFMMDKHIYKSDAYQGSRTSDEVDHSTSSYAYTPIGLNWYEIKQNSIWGMLNLEPDKNNPIDTPLICASCTNVEEAKNGTAFYLNMCFQEATCANNLTDEYANRWGLCSCPIGYRGYLCEYEENCIDDYNQTCFNGGTCITSDDLYHGTCTCLAGFTGHLCQYIA